MSKDRGRVDIPPSVWSLRSNLIDSGLVDVPLDGTMALRGLDLTALHGDPAHRFIATSALVREAVLVTADERLLTWKSDLERCDAAR